MKALVGAGALIPLGLIAGFGFFDSPEREGLPELEKQIAELDQRTPGALGVYIKHLGDGRELNYGSDRQWYLASTIKVPVAIATLQDVDTGKLALDERLELQETDKVDGPGELVWQKAGAEISVDDLLEDMLQVSDSTATGVLIRRLGTDELNSRIKQDMTGGNIGKITSILDMRYGLYGELTPHAENLTNEQIVSIASEPLGDARVAAVAKVLDMQVDELDTRTLDEAYARYYATGDNAAELKAFGEILERTVRGDLLKPDSAGRLYRYMKLGQYDGYRLEAGLDREIPFAHKTGTQFERTCHVGVVDPMTPERAIVVAACVADTDEDEAADTLTEVGKLLNTMVAQSAPEPAGASAD
jgi:beta-lactamase class A